MRLEELKRGLWGYKKDAVFQYISEQEEAFSQKMSEKDAQAERAGQQAQDRIQALEQENSELREELARLRELQDQISQAILDARSSAEALKSESRALEECAREQVRQTLEKELSALAVYREKVAALRGTILATMAGMDQKAEELERQVDELREGSPAGNLTLFR